MGKNSFKKVPKPILVVAVLFVFAVAGSYLLAASHAAGTATLALNPASSNVSLGSNITVSIIENSGTTGTNAVEADLVYDQTKLQYVSIDTSTSPFDLGAQSVGGNGTVSISRGASTAQTGQQTFAIVTFKAIGLGASNITFANTSGIADASNQTAILGTATGATYTVVDAAAPTVPTALTATTRTATSIALSWTASTDNVAVTGYKVYRGGTQIGTSTTATYTDSGLATGTNYSYTVAAYDAVGNTSAQSSALATSTLADTTAPSVPTNLNVTSQTTTSVSLSWTGSTDDVAVAGYRIYRAGTQVATTTGTTYTNTGLTPGTSYIYTVAAYDAAGNVSAQSTSKSTTTLTVAGDANNDGHVDYLDLSILASTWQSSTDLRADFNHDNVINYLDLSSLASNWGK